VKSNTAEKVRFDQAASELKLENVYLYRSKIFQFPAMSLIPFVSTLFFLLPVI